MAMSLLNNESIMNSIVCSGLYFPIGNVHSVNRESLF